MSIKTINREASDKTKGFRLQKIRAIDLIFETMILNPDAFYFTAIEEGEDVYHRVSDDNSDSTYYEEDKNYSLDANFTIFNDAVKNTLVSFFDIYVNKFRCDSNIRLGFYTTRGIGKEKKGNLNDGSIIELPCKPILELLKSPVSMSDSEVELVKKILLDEYRKQYSDIQNIVPIENASYDLMRDFLGQITWFFGQDNEEELKTSVIEKIKSSHLFTEKHNNREEVIYALLMETIEERQNRKKLSLKLISNADVKLIFKQAESETPSPAMDPTWINFQDEEIIDKRTLDQKITAVVHDYPKAQLKHLARKVCRSKSEQANTDKSILSLKYRILETCRDHFFESGYNVPNNKSDLDSKFLELFNLSQNTVNELKKDFEYKYSNDIMIQGLILSLFDECYLQFEELSDE
jgi:hypothetical protein